MAKDRLVQSRVPVGDAKALEELAKADGRTIAGYLRIVIADHVQAATKAKAEAARKVKS